QAAGIDVYLSEKIIHLKMMLFDEETVILGSANISVFSMQNAVALDIVIRENPAFLDAIRQTVSRRIGESKKSEFDSRVAEVQHSDLVSPNYSLKI
ncbi:MAG: phosphatidylserine/phosphatidylglycerophosphate/cardiolipin synthase family protein, partial [Planctomycetes bacterium]|nr:phosphatidylserine/phosphatidylglycerophosphate/cardiolipin synthase family protein [Planctomycetota bacterium]